LFYQKTHLANGLGVISEHMDGVRSVTLGIWFRVGSRDEQPNQSGISHFMEHMMFKGTSKRSALDISMAFDAMGAELNAFTSKEYTCYYARMLDDHLEKAIEILADMVENSQFAQDAIDSEREVVIEEIARYEDTPDDHVGDIFTEAMFPTHQLGRSVLGTRLIVGAFAHDDCRAYHQKHYHAGNAMIAATGSIDHTRLVELCEQYFGGIPSGVANSRGEVTEKNRQLLTFEQKETEQAHLIYGRPGSPLGDDDRYAGRLLDTVLGGPMSSRLFQEIREKRGLAYAVYATTVPYINASQFVVYVGTRPSNLEEVVALLRSEVAKILRDGISADELERVRDYNLGHMVLAMESTQQRMIRLGSNAVQDLAIYSLEQTIERYRAVTLADIKRVAQRILSQEPTVAVISPLDKAQLEKIVA
jgi:predicted Zn-dependent peptidase